MTAALTEAHLRILRGLGLDQPARTWLVKAMTEINLKNARIPGSTVQEDLLLELLGRRWPQDNLSREQRDEIFWLLLGQDYKSLNSIILLAKHSM